MNIIYSIIYGFAFGILFIYIFINTFISEYHALDSNKIRKKIINIDKHKFKLTPYRA